MISCSLMLQKFKQCVNEAFFVTVFNRACKVVCLSGVIIVGSFFQAISQPAKAKATTIARPKLVVGIVVDQMRWDYLYRFYDRYTDKGFKRLLNEGFSCESAYINYIPSATAVGHSTIFSGSVPAIHGITGNVWIDRNTGNSMYCTGDSTVKTVGSTTKAGQMSPRNLLATTISDELRIATNFRSKVIGISLKDRASILPVGHNPTGAYWFDDSSGNFITSTYYMPELPDWVRKFNDQKNVERLVSNGWNTLYPINTYTQSTADNISWERKFRSETASVFPHDIAKIYKADRSSFRRTPFGNTFTLDFANAAIEANQLGMDDDTDFLTINCASTDYVGHMFGPNSIEVEDVYLRLDKDLGSFFEGLDKKLGKGNYLVFLTADHGAGNSYQFNKLNKLPSGLLDTAAIVSGLNKKLEEKYAADNIVSLMTGNQIYFNYELIDKKKFNFSEIKEDAVNFIRRQPGVAFAVDMDKLEQSTIPGPVKTILGNSYNFKRSGDIQIVNEPGFNGPPTGASHGSWNPYDVHIPLLFMGWGVKHGVSNNRVNMTDIAPTVASFLHIQIPSGAIGKPIIEVLANK